MKVTKPTTAQVNQSTTAQQATPIASPSVKQTQTSTPDAIVSANQGAPVNTAQLGEQHELGVGRGGSKPSSGGSSKKLSADELKQIAGVGGAGLKGRGRIEGEVEKRFGKYVLVTAAEGSKSEVRFTLDLAAKDLRGLEGQKVALEGMLEKQAPWGGKITGAKFSATAPSVKVGSNQVLSGKIENRHVMGIGGEAPPSGSWLVLDKPIRVHDKKITEVFIQGEERKSGSHARLHGRIDEGSWGGVETKGGKYVALSGISNEAKGEPRALVDGRFVSSKTGATLDTLHYNRPLMYDAPAKVFVLDGDKVFLGSQGGHIPPHMNSFHGFSGAAKIEQASTADQKALKFDADGVPHNKQGEALVLISPEPSATPPYPDFMSQLWYFDASNSKAYRVDNGGIAGFHNLVSATIDTSK